MEGKTNFSRRLKQVDGLTWLTLTPLIYDRSTPLYVRFNTPILPVLASHLRIQLWEILSREVSYRSNCRRPWQRAESWTSRRRSPQRETLDTGCVKSAGRGHWRWARRRSAVTSTLGHGYRLRERLSPGDSVNVTRSQVFPPTWRFLSHATRAQQYCHILTDVIRSIALYTLMYST